jgi:mono/diheme cytochrome c family protein
MSPIRLPPLLLGGVAGLALVAAVALANLALASPSPPPIATATTAPAAAMGKQLFVAKGCATCHRHAGIEDKRQYFIGEAAPDLTNYRNDPTFLHSWLKDPKAVRSTALMPNLELKQAEIEALIAFLNNPETAK